MPAPWIIWMCYCSEGSNTGRSSVDRQRVVRLDVEDEAVGRRLGEPHLALPAHGHEGHALAGDGALEEVSDALALHLELEVAPERDHRALAGQDLTVHGVLDALGVLQAHACLGWGLGHVFGLEDVTAHAAAA